MSQRRNLCTENFRQALAVKGEPRKFIELIARSLGSSARDLLAWANSFERDEELGKNINEALNDGGVDDEWKFLWNVCGDSVSTAYCHTGGPGGRGHRALSGDESSPKDSGDSASEKPASEKPKLLVGNKMNELLDSVVQTVSGVVVSGGNRCIVIHGEPLSGKTTFLMNMNEKLTRERRIFPVPYRELAYGDVSQGNVPNGVITLDDADMEIISPAVEQKIIRFIRNGERVMIVTCRDVKKLKNLVHACDALVYTIPLPRDEEIITIFSRLMLRGYTVSSGTARKILNLLNAFGVQNKMATGIDAIRMLLYPCLFADYTRGITRAAIRSVHCKRPEVEKAVSRVIGVRVLPATEETGKRLAHELKNRIKGQDHVVDEVLPTLVTIASGLTDPSRPAGVFLFYGPTGCGKTQCGRVIADILYNGVLHKEDMNTYNEKHSVSRIIGSPPGYVGHDDTTSLLECIDTHARGVLLFDEIEKSHEIIKDHILELLDTGVIRDAKGKTHDARGFLIIITSNVTCGRKNAITMGFDRSSDDCARIDPLTELKSSGEFRNEFIDRIDVVSRFNMLEEAEMKEIGCIMLDELLKRLRSIGIQTDQRDALLEEIFHIYKIGKSTRKMKKYIETHVKNKLLTRARKKDHTTGGVQ